MKITTLCAFFSGLECCLGWKPCVVSGHIPWSPRELPLPFLPLMWTFPSAKLLSSPKRTKLLYLSWQEQESSQSTVLCGLRLPDSTDSVVTDLRVPSLRWQKVWLADESMWMVISGSTLKVHDLLPPLYAVYVFLFYGRVLSPSIVYSYCCHGNHSHSHHMRFGGPACPWNTPKEHHSVKCAVLEADVVSVPASQQRFNTSG